MNPEFGCDLRTVLFEGITDTTADTIRELINDNVNIFVPEVQIIEIIINNDEDHNIINITVNYRLKISQDADQITVQFI